MFLSLLTTKYVYCICGSLLTMRVPVNIFSSCFSLLSYRLIKVMFLLLTSMLARHTQSSWRKANEREEDGIMMHQNKLYKHMNSLSIFLLKLLLKKIMSLNRTTKHKRMNESFRKRRKVSGTSSMNKLLNFIILLIFLLSCLFYPLKATCPSFSHVLSLSYILYFPHIRNQSWLSPLAMENQFSPNLSRI